MGLCRFMLLGCLFLLSACGGAELPDADTAPEPENTSAEAPDLDTIVRSAIEAHRAGEYDRALELSLQAEALLPDHPRLLYNTACAYAKTNQSEAALDRLEHIATMQIVMDLRSSASLESLYDHPRFADVLATMEANAAPVERSSVELRFPDPTFLVEGVAYDSVTGDLLLSSLYQRRIVRVTADGEVKDFTRPSEGLWSMLGMVVDADRNHLWTITVAGPRMLGAGSDEPLRSALILLSLEDGSELSRYPAPNHLADSALDSLAVADDGTVYVSDSGAGAVHRLVPDAEELEIFLPPGTFFSTQGLELSADESVLYVADYGRGVFAVDLESKNVRFLEHEGSTLLGIDGLERHGDDLIAIQNGIQPPRVVRIVLAPDEMAIDRVDLLERAHPLYREPTLGTVVGDDLIYVAASQWQSFNEEGELLRDELVEPAILRLPLTD